MLSELPPLLAFAGGTPLFAYSEWGQLLLIDIEKKTWKRVGEYPEMFGGVEQDRVKVRLHPAPDGLPYIAIVQDYGEFGILVNWQTGKVLLLLNRKDYNTEQTEFPFVWWQRQGQLAFVHATDWNQVAIHCIENDQVQFAHPPESDMDYFFGSLRLSPNAKRISTNGWRWHPIPILLVVPMPDSTEPLALMPVFKEMKREFWAMSSYWDRAMAWIDDAHILLWYSPAEDEESIEENEKCIEWGIKTKEAHLLVWNVEQGKVIRHFPFSHFAETQYHEPEGAQLIIQDNYIFAVCVKNGLGVYRLDNGKHVATNLRVLPPCAYDAAQKRFVVYTPDKKLELYAY